MALVPVDLPAPDELRNRWAAFSAVMAALNYGGGSNAVGGLWHYDDGGGNWAELALLGGGRAVLFGHDHEYSETYFREAATYFQEEETDLLAEAPDWWETPLPVGDDQWIGFVYGFDGTSWLRADYALDDGFNSVALPAASFDRFGDLVAEFVKGHNRDHDVECEVDPAAVVALAAAGPELTVEQLAAVVGPSPAQWQAGVDAARAFRRS
jgi:hypothetical protein